MTAREKVIKGLEHCIADNCDLCPYDENVDCPGFDLTPKTLLEDVLALLKAQEPLKPVPSDRYVRTEPITFDYKCVVCNAGLVRHWVCCPCCGWAVKWE